MTTVSGVDFLLLLINVLIARKNEKKQFGETVAPP